MNKVVNKAVNKGVNKGTNKGTIKGVQEFIATKFVPKAIFNADMFTVAPL